MKLALGTAQFGLDYGINNRVGKISSEEALKILKLASGSGVDLVDTAFAYGESEKIIGNFLKSTNCLKIVTKLPAGNKRGTEEVFADSLKRIDSKEVYGYLVHDFKMVRERPEIWGEFEQLKMNKQVKKVGFSLYYPDELDYLFDKRISFDLLQVPYNLLDRRFEGYFKTLKESNVEIHTRSTFLQGLFFVSQDKLKGNIKKAENLIKQIRNISSENDIPLNALCLCFVLLNQFIDKVIVGVDSLVQFKENLGSLEYLEKTKNIYSLLKGLRSDDESIIVPDKWS